MGVARPKAHGQEITKTPTPKVNASSKTELKCPIEIIGVLLFKIPAINHEIKTTKAIIITVGVKILATLSTFSVKGVFILLASATKEAILFKTLSFLSLFTKMVIGASLLTLPPITWSSSTFNIGKDSPEIIDSSTLVFPLNIIPSAGIVSPTLTTNLSFNLISFELMSIISLFSNLCAVLGLKASNALIVDFALFLDKFSIYLPKKQILKSLHYYLNIDGNAHKYND